MHSVVCATTFTLLTVPPPKFTCMLYSKYMREGNRGPRKEERERAGGGEEGER